MRAVAARAALAAALLLTTGLPARVMAQALLFQGAVVDLSPWFSNDPDDPSASVGIDLAGTAVAAYEYDNAIEARRVGPTGQLQPPIQVSSDPARPARHAAVAVAADGSFTVAWSSHAEWEWEGPHAIYARGFGADGAPLGPAVLLSSVASMDVYPAVVRSGGEVLVAWARLGETGSSIVARRISPAAQPLAAEGVLAGGPLAALGYPSLARLDDGRLVATWRREVEQDHQRTMHAEARILSVQGVPAAATITVGTLGGHELERPALAAGTGDWVVVMPRGGLFLRRFGNDGQPLGGEQQVTDGAPGGEVKRPVVAADAHGRYLVAWQQQTGNFEHQVAVRQLIDGALVGKSQQVTAGLGTRENHAPALAGHGYGEYQLVWRRYEEPQARLTGRLIAGPGAIAFAEEKVRVREGDGTASLTVLRSGSAGAVSVQYQTLPQTAQPGSDFTTAAGTLTWADGDVTPRTIDVALLDDDVQEPYESFQVTLHSPGGGATLGLPSTATVTIVDDDGWPAAVGAEVTLSEIGWGPQVANDSQGASLTIWSEPSFYTHPAVMAALHTGGGSPIGGAFMADVGTRPALARSPSGTAVVVALGGPTELHARRLDAVGNAVGAEIAVNGFYPASPDPGAPDVDTASDGGFVVVWHASNPGVWSQYSVLARRFAADGTPLAAAYVVHSQDLGVQRNPRVAVRADGSFLAVWEHETLGGPPPRIYGRLFAASGTPAGTELAISNSAQGAGLPDVAAFADGTFLVVWHDVEVGAIGGISGRIVSAAGTPIDTQFAVNTYEPAGQFQPRVAADGNVAVVVWTSGNEPGWGDDSEAQDGEYLGVFGQRLDSAGNRIGAEFQVNTTAEGSQHSAVVAVASSGAFVVAWEQWEYDTLGNVSAQGIQQQRFAAGEASYLTSEHFPDFRFEVTIAPSPGTSIPGVKEASCIPETLCISGAVPGRSEVFVRLVGPKPNGYLWPTLVKFSTSEVKVRVTQISTGLTKTYVLPGAFPGSSELPGLFDRLGYLPNVPLPSSGASGTSQPVTGAWFTSPQFPGFRFKVRISNQQGEETAVQLESSCIEETVCLSGAVPGRSELFLRIVGPKPNGYLWPTLVKFSTSTIEVWVEQMATAEQKYYRLEGAAPGVDELTGLFDRTGFLP